MRWTRRLYDAIHNSEEIPARLGSAVPLWWNGGRSFEAPPELVDISATPSIEGPTVKMVEDEEEALPFSDAVTWQKELEILYRDRVSQHSYGKSTR